MKKFRPKYCLTLIFLQLIFVRAYGITAEFTYSKVSNCAPTVVMFTNNSTRGTGIIYTWDFGLGAIVTATDYTTKEQLYNQAGQYTVRLIASNGSESDTASAIISISKGPVASFIADPSSGCSPLLVNFTSTSTPGESNIVTTLWDFRNGDYGTGSPASYQYYNPGQYSVLLKVTDSNGCFSQVESEKVITVVDKPVVDFKASETFGCSAPLNVYFTNLSEGSSELKYEWNFGNGDRSSDISASSVYDTAGTYSVGLKVTDIYGCSDSLTRDSYISVGYEKGTLTTYDAKGNVFDKSFLCDGLYKFEYSDPNLPSYEWTVTDNDEISTYSGDNSIIYQVSGSGKITVKVVFGKSAFCTDSITVSFSKSYIKADFILEDTVFCSVPQTLNLVNASQNADNVAWYLSGNFLSNLKETTCSVTQSDLREQTYEQAYSHNLTYYILPVKLVASNGGVCYDSLTRNITIVKPLARFVPDKVSGCIPLEISLADSSKSAFPIDSYTYLIGTDQVVTSDKTPASYTITTPGIYDVTEIVSSTGCYDTSNVVRIIAGEKLKPDFTVSPSEVCNGSNITLSGSTDKESEVNLWRFFSAGLFDLYLKSGPDTTVNIYTEKTGYKDISLQVDYNGCISDTTKENVLNIIGPYGNFTGSFSCDSSMKYHFVSDISHATSLIWAIDTSLVYNADSVDYTFPESRDYPVTLTATDLSTGCTLKRTRIFSVRDVTATFSLTDTVFCAGDTVNLDASLSGDFINTCYNEGFLWHFGDDSPPRRTYLSNYYHVYTSRGYDTITLAVTGDNGCIDTTNRVIFVSRPEGSFSSDKTSGCVPGMTVNFVNTSTDTTIVMWIWNFGDNTSDSTNSTSVSHVYSSDVSKVYYPVLTVYDSWSCSSSYSVPTHLVGINGDFQADDNSICLGEDITFTPADTSVNILYWNFGDGTISLTTATHTYATAGEYSVSMASALDGCQDTVTKLNYVTVEEANANFTASDTVLNCYPETVDFVHDNTISSEAVEYLWKFGSNTLTDRTSGTVDYTFTRPGDVLVQLTVRTLNGCEASSSKEILVAGPDAAINFFPSEICYNGAVTFSLDSMQNLDSWKWFFGDGATSTENPATHIYTSRGKIVPSVQLVNPTCTATRILDTLYVSEVEAAFKSSDSIYVFCFGKDVDLVNNSKNSSSWNWLVDNVHVSYGYNLSNLVFSKTGEHTVSLIATSASGCTDTLTRTFTVYPVPEVYINGDSIICAGQGSLTLSVNENSGDKITWTPSDGISDQGAFTVIASPVVTTTYTAKVTNSSGCSGTDEITIHVNEPFELERSPLNDTTIYCGDKIQLSVNTDESDVSYKWYPARDISCTDCAEPWVNPSESTTYYAILSNGCFNDTVTFNITVLWDFYVEAPSAFTPNGDSNNDIFRFESKNIEEFELRIFNRWGDIVFSTDDINQGWDGKANGRMQNIDTYKYTLRIKSVNGCEITRKGEFLLLR